jgi:hypothetical protein
MVRLRDHRDRVDFLGGHHRRRLHLRAGRALPLSHKPESCGQLERVVLRKRCLELPSGRPFFSERERY